MRKTIINTSPFLIILAFLAIFGVVAYILLTRNFNNVLLNGVIFLLGALFVLKQSSISLHRIRASLFKEGDLVIIIQKGQDREHGNFERLIVSPEDWMPDNLKNMIVTELLKTNIPMAVVSQNGGLAVTTPDRLIIEN